MKDKIERILMKYGGLNLWSQQVRNSLIDDLDNELHFSSSSQISIDNKKEKDIKADIKAEVKDEKSPLSGDQTTGDFPGNGKTEKKTRRKDKKSIPVRRSSKKSRNKSDNRNVEKIEMLPETHQ